jgi:diaminobutyrate-2-oxoglutarate transaminase
MMNELSTRRSLRGQESPVNVETQRRARDRPYVFGEHELLTRQAQRESNARSYPRRLPLVLRRAQGVYVEDVEGRVFLDCLAAAGTLALGHNHPVVVEAIVAAVRSGVPLQTLDLMTPVKDEFVSELWSLLPPAFAGRARIQFCGPSGSDAIEAALKLVKTATGRSSVLSFHGAYHGMSQGSLALMGNRAPKQHAQLASPGVQFLPYPYEYRCPFGLGGRAGEAAGLAYMRTVLDDPHSGVLRPAGMLLEAIQGEGGVVPASPSWLREVRAMTRASEVPLVFDEVQTGFGRTGDMFAFQCADVVPDVLVISKAVGGGLPLSAIVYDAALDTWQPGAHAGTFRGNQLAMAAGAATLRFLREQQLHLHAHAMGDRLFAQLRALQSQHAFLGDVRGRGLMVGIEIVDPSGEPDAQGHPPVDPGRCSALQRACLARGLIAETGGRQGATLRLLPPLIITAEQVDQIADIVALAACELAQVDRR